MQSYFFELTISSQYLDHVVQSDNPSSGILSLLQQCVHESTVNILVETYVSSGAHLSWNLEI